MGVRAQALENAVSPVAFASLGGGGGGRWWSTAKGTALKSGSHADLVVFAEPLKSYTSQDNERCNIIKEIHKQLEACQQKDFEVKFEISKWKAPRVLSLTLKSKVLK